MLDAADHARVDEARAVLQEALADARIRGKPLLVFANKQDVDGAMPADAVAASLGLVGGDAMPEQFNIMACTAKPPPRRSSSAQGQEEGDAADPRDPGAAPVDRCAHTASAAPHPARVPRRPPTTDPAPPPVVAAP